MKDFEIMFDDLNGETQVRFLTFQGLSCPDDGNYGTVPIAVVGRETTEEGE